MCAVCFNVRWGSNDGPTIDEINEEMLDNARGDTWYSSEEYSRTQAAFDWGVPLDEWEQKAPEHRAQMWEFAWTRDIKRNWEAWINRPK